MTTLDQALTGLSALLNTFPGLRAYDYPPTSPELPCAFLRPPAINHDDIGMSSGRYSTEIIFLVPAVEDRYVKQLRQYQDVSGPNSLLVLIQANRDLGFDDVDAYVDSWRPLQVDELARYGGYGAACTLMIQIG